MSESKLYKVGDTVPAAGRYECIICGLIVEYTEAHISQEAVFAECTLCKSGTAGGPKGEHEDFWRKL